MKPFFFRPLPLNRKDNWKYGARSRPFNARRCDDMADQKYKDKAPGSYAAAIAFHPTITDPDELKKVFKAMVDGTADAKVDHLYLTSGNHNERSHELVRDRFIAEKNYDAAKLFERYKVQPICYLKKQPDEGNKEFCSRVCQVYKAVSCFCNAE